MKTEVDKLNTRRINGCVTMTVALVCFAVFALLLLVSVFRTVIHVEDAYFGERVLSELDNGFLNIILLTILVSASYLTYRACEHIKLGTLMILMLIWTLVLGCGFVYSASRAPEGDAEIIANTAYLASNGNFTAMSDYLDEYPFSIGMAFFDELVFRFLQFGFPQISKGYCFMALQVLNVLLLCATFFSLVKITGLLYESEDMQKQVCLLLMLFLPAIFQCTSLSGRIPSFAFSMFSIWALLVYFKKHSLVHAVLSGIFFGISMSMKLDSVVLLVLFLLLFAFRMKNLKAVVAFVLFVLFSVALFSVPNAVCEHRVKTEFENSELSIRTIMGLDESEEGSLIYAGMYSAVSSDISKSTGSVKRQDATDLLTAVQQQWNEPSFCSLYSNQSSRHYRDTGRFYNLVCDFGEELLLEFMNLFQSFLLIGAVFSMVKLLRERDFLKLLPALIFMGGIVLHLVFPADSRYAMKYYLALIPLTAYGFGAFFGRWAKKGKE